MFESPLFCWIDVDAPQVMSCWGEEEVVVVVVGGRLSQENQCLFLYRTKLVITSNSIKATLGQGWKLCR